MATLTIPSERTLVLEKLGQIGKEDNVAILITESSRPPIPTILPA